MRCELETKSIYSKLTENLYQREYTIKDCIKFDIPFTKRMVMATWNNRKCISACSKEEYEENK